MAQAQRDQNSVPTLLGVSSTDGVTPVVVYANPTTHRLLIDNAGTASVTSINADTTAAQTLSVGTSGTDFAVSDGGSGAHTFNLPTASSVNRGALSSADWTTFNNKQVALVSGTSIKTINSTSLLGSGDVAVQATLVSGTTIKTVGGTSLLGSGDVSVGTGTVTAVSVATANGFSGTSSGGATPALTLNVDGTHYLPTTTDQTNWNAKGTGTVTAVSVATANGVSGTSSGGATPALTISLGAITPSTVNGNTITTGTGTLTLSAGKTLAQTNSITHSGTDGTTMTYPTTSATLARTDAANTFTGHQTIEGVTSTGATGSGKFVFDTSPTLATPTIGVATATSINKVTITAPATSAILTIADGKTLTANNSIALTGTDSTTMTFPTTTATIARTDAAQTFTGTQTFSQIINTVNAIAASANAATVPITSRINKVTNNSAATLTITMTTTSAVDGQLSMVRVLDFSAAAQTITWVNTENSTVTAPTTSNGSTTLPLTVGFQYNGGTSKWRCIASA